MPENISHPQMNKDTTFGTSGPASSVARTNSGGHYELRLSLDFEKGHIQGRVRYHIPVISILRASMDLTCHPVSPMPFVLSTPECEIQSDAMLEIWENFTTKFNRNCGEEITSAPELEPNQITRPSQDTGTQSSCTNPRSISPNAVRNESTEQHPWSYRIPVDGHENEESVLSSSNSINKTLMHTSSHESMTRDISQSNMQRLLAQTLVSHVRKQGEQTELYFTQESLMCMYNQMKSQSTFPPTSVDGLEAESTLSTSAEVLRLLTSCSYCLVLSYSFTSIGDGHKAFHPAPMHYTLFTHLGSKASDRNFIQHEPICQLVPHVHGIFRKEANILPSVRGTDEEYVAVHKATYALKLNIPHDMTASWNTNALAEENIPVAESQPNLFDVAGSDSTGPTSLVTASSGRKIVTFQVTPPLERHQLALVVGYMQAMRPMMGKSGRQFRVVVPEGCELAHTRTALDVTLKAFEYFETIFPRQLSALWHVDIVAINCDISLPMMGHWGIIPLPIDHILVCESTSILTRQDLTLMIIREVARHWFGGVLAAPVSTTDTESTEAMQLEGIALFATYVCLDAQFPRWCMSIHFTTQVLEPHRLRNTRWDFWVACILRMLVSFLGETLVLSALFHLLKEPVFQLSSLWTLLNASIVPPNIGNTTTANVGTNEEFPSSSLPSQINVVSFVEQFLPLGAHPHLYVSCDSKFNRAYITQFDTPAYDEGLCGAHHHEYVARNVRLACPETNSAPQPTTQETSLTPTRESMDNLALSNDPLTTITTDDHQDHNLQTAILKDPATEIPSACKKDNGESNALSIMKSPPAARSNSGCSALLSGYDPLMTLSTPCGVDATLQTTAFPVEKLFKPGNYNFPLRVMEFRKTGTVQTQVFSIQSKLIWIDMEGMSFVLNEGHSSLVRVSYSTQMWDRILEVRPMLKAVEKVGLIQDIAAMKLYNVCYFDHDEWARSTLLLRFLKECFEDESHCIVWYVIGNELYKLLCLTQDHLVGDSIRRFVRSCYRYVLSSPTFVNSPDASIFEYNPTKIIPHYVQAEMLRNLALSGDRSVLEIAQEYVDIVMHSFVDGSEASLGWNSAVKPWYREMLAVALSIVIGNPERDIDSIAQGWNNAFKVYSSLTSIPVKCDPVFDESLGVHTMKFKRLQNVPINVRSHIRRACLCGLVSATHSSLLRWTVNLLLEEAVTMDDLRQAADYAVYNPRLLCAIINSLNSSASQWSHRQKLLVELFINEQRYRICNLGLHALILQRGDDIVKLCRPVVDMIPIFHTWLQLSADSITKYINECGILPSSDSCNTYDVSQCSDLSSAMRGIKDSV